MQIRFGAGDEEGTRPMQHMQAREIDIAAIHDIGGAGLGQHEVESVNVVQLAVRDMDEARDAAAQIEQGVHLYRRLGGAKVRPRKQREAQIDGGRIQSIDRVVQVQAQILVDIESSGLADQSLRQLRVDAPVAPLVGIGQRRSPYRFAKTHVVELRGLRRQAGLDVAQALSIGKLRKGHCSVLLRAGERSHPAIAIVACDDTREGTPRQKIHNLSEQRLADIHGRILGKSPKTAPRRSNRHHPSSPRNPRQSCLS
jgi:hypothetical protein